MRLCLLQHRVRSFRVSLDWNQDVATLYDAYQLTLRVVEWNGQEEG